MVVPDEWLGTVVQVCYLALTILISSNLAVFFYFLIFGDALNKSLFLVILQRPNDYQQRLIKICTYFGISTIISISTAIWACNSENFQDYVQKHYFISGAGTSIVLFLSMLFISGFSYEDKYYPKLFFFIMHALLSAPASCAMGNDIAIKSVLYTTQLIFILVTVALTAHEDFHKKISGPLAGFGGFITAVSLITSLIGPPKNIIEIIFFCLSLHAGFIYFAWVFILNIQLFASDTFYLPDKFDPIYIGAVMQISSLNFTLRMGTFVTMSDTLENYHELEFLRIS